MSRPKPKPDYVASDDCDLSPICSPLTVGQHTYDFTGQMVKRRHFFKRGELIFQQGEPAHLVYAILLHLGLRFKASGYFATQFTLTMTRSDIANYLGLAKETVIRMMQKLQQKGLIQTEGKQLTICKLASF